MADTIYGLSGDQALGVYNQLQAPTPTGTTTQPYMTASEAGYKGSGLSDVYAAGVSTDTSNPFTMAEAQNRGMTADAYVNSLRTPYSYLRPDFGTTTGGATSVGNVSAQTNQLSTSGAMQGSYVGFNDLEQALMKAGLIPGASGAKSNVYQNPGGSGAAANAIENQLNPQANQELNTPFQLSQIASGTLGTGTATNGQLPNGWDATTYANFKAANPTLEPDAFDTFNMKGINALQPGSTNTTSVKALQDYLVSQNLMKQEDLADGGYGVYGPKTTAAVKALQEKLGIDNSSGPGYFGPKTIEALKNPANKALADAKKSGLDPGTGSASQAQNFIDQNTPPPPQPQAPTTTPNVDNFFQTNPGVAQSTQDLMAFLSPQSTQTEIANTMKKLAGEQNTLTQENLQLMNYKNLMSGTEGDIRSEITAANGFATDSQVQALTVARNKTLLKQATFLQDQIAAQQDLVKNDTTLLQNEKEMANTQFTQRLGVLNYQQENQKNMLSASKDALNFQVQALGFDGLYAAYKNDPAQLANIEKLTGMTAGGLKQAADYAATQRANALSKESLANQLTQSQIAENKAQTAKAYADGKKVTTDAANDGKLLSVSDAKALQVPYGTTVGQAKAMGKTPSDLTTSTQTMIQTAPQVKNFVNKVTKEITDAAAGLGPMASRWRDLKAGKIGLSDPAFSELTTNAGLLTTLLMRMHVGARGSSEIMDHFTKMLDITKSSPDNLLASLNAIGEYADSIIAEGKQGSAPISGQTVQSNGQTYNVGQVYNDGTANWTIDANGKWTKK